MFFRDEVLLDLISLLYQAKVLDQSQRWNRAELFHHLDEIESELKAVHILVSLLIFLFLKADEVEVEGVFPERDAAAPFQRLCLDKELDGSFLDVEQVEWAISFIHDQVRKLIVIEER